MKIFRIVMCIVLALLMLAGCNNTGADNDTTTPAQDTSLPTSDTAQDGKILFSDDVSYTIIRAEDSPQVITDIAVALKNRIADMLESKSIKINTDWVRRGEQPDPETREILVGYTNRDETAQVIQTLNNGDFAIRTVGNKVVIAACTADDLRTAAEYFTSQLVSVEKQGDKNIMKMKQDYTYLSGNRNLFDEANPLSTYRLVYASGNKNTKDAADRLASAVEKLCGVKLDVVPDKTAAQDCEILVGLSSRSQTAVLKNMTGLEYTVRTDGKKLVIGGGTNMSTMLAADEFATTFLSGMCVPDFRISDNYLCDGKGSITLSDGEDPALAEGADLRIMSFNILAELWNDKPPVAGRDTNVARILYCYRPDVVGLQEVTAVWYDALDNLMEGTYAFAVRTIPSGGPDYSTLMYNTETVELLDSGCTVYSQGNSPLLRNLTWGYFRRKSDGTTFIVTSTHWDLGSNAAMQQVQAVENAKLINELVAKYKCPVFSTGDYNQAETSYDFKGFMAATGMQDPKYTADVINRACKTTHTRGSKPSASAAVCIDHIATSAGVDVRYYNTLFCSAAIDASDHCPIYIDVKLK